jgi:dephospho-CoA kinase
VSDRQRRPLVVALTGGIASGKSAVSDRLAALGAPVFDADLAARAVVEPGTPGLAAIVSGFGAGVLDAGGRLDRAAMRRRIFDDPAARERLEGVIHPRVREHLAARVRDCESPYCVLAIPLLAESGRYPWIDTVVVVDAPEAAQLQRLMRRDGIDEALARSMLAAQASREERLRLADEVIVNDGTIEALQAATDALHARLLEHSRAPR